MLITEQIIPPGERCNVHPLHHSLNSFARLDDIGVSSSNSTRNAGWHVAGILRNIAVRAGFEDWEIEDGANGYEQFSTGDLSTFKHLNWKMLLGFAWEYYIIARIPSPLGTLHSPGESSLPTSDGKSLIYMNCDGHTSQVIWEGDGPNKGDLVSCVEECKLTYKSAKHPPSRIWTWQGASYCKLTGTCYLRIHALYVNGMYEKSRIGEPIHKLYWVEFEPQEIDQIWYMISNYVAREEGRL